MREWIIPVAVMAMFAVPALATGRGKEEEHHCPKAERCWCDQDGDKEEDEDMVDMRRPGRPGHMMDRMLDEAIAKLPETDRAKVNELREQMAQAHVEHRLKMMEIEKQILEIVAKRKTGTK